MFNFNFVVVVKYFQYRVEIFFIEVLFINVKLIGKIVYYVFRIEFQMRGSFYLYVFIWCDDCFKLIYDNKQVYIDYIDKYVQVYLLSKEEDVELYDLVKMYQKYSYFKICRKYKNI